MTALKTLRVNVARSKLIADSLSIHINLLHKILNLVLNYKELNYLFKQKTL